MTPPRPTLIVLTPVKNEAWILDRFLGVCSQFADLILLADQHSTDGSRGIAARWPKARVIENASPAFNEAERQKLLIEAARRQVPGPRILLALDADEIPTADSLASPDWKAFLAAPPGTVLMLEKIDLLPDGTCLRYDQPFPYGYVDDGAEHQPRWIHSYRVPVRPESPRLQPHGIKLLHYAYVRPKTQRLKMCLYAAIENRKAPLRLKSILSRRLNYGRKKDWLGLGRREQADPAWFRGWEEKGIDLGPLPDGEETWQAWACLQAMAEAGEKRFWYEDIWDIDWERLRQRGQALGVPGLPARAIRRPPRLLGWLLDGADGVAQRLKS